MTDDNDPSDNRDLVSVTEAARRLGVTPETIRARLRRGSLEGEKLGRMWYVVMPSDEHDMVAPGKVPRSKKREAPAAAIARDQTDWHETVDTWHKTASTGTSIVSILTSLYVVGKWILAAIRGAGWGLPAPPVLVALAGMLLAQVLIIVGAARYVSTENESERSSMPMPIGLFLFTASLLGLFRYIVHDTYEDVYRRAYDFILSLLPGN